MELQIDTNSLSFKHKNIEEIVNYKINEIDNYLEKTKPELKESFLIKVHYFLFENSETRSLVLYGEIINNNQTFYDYKKHEQIFIYTNNALIINKLISLFIKANNDKNKEFELIMEFEIDDIFIFKYNENQELNVIYMIMIYLTSSLKIFFGFFRKFKFIKWENILINSKYYQETYLLSHIFSMIGYKNNINISNFNHSLEEDFFIYESVLLENESKIKIETLNISEENENKFYNHIFDTIGLETLKTKHKLNIFKILKNGGNLIILESENEPKAQLDPQDLILLLNKNISLNFCNIESYLKINETIGRELNFITELFNQFNKNNQSQHVKKLIKKLECKIYDTENIKEITIKELSNRNNYLTLFLINK